MRGQNFLIYLIVSILFVTSVNGFASEETKEQETVYRLNYKIDLPLTLGLFGLSYFGFNHLADKEGVSYEKAISLSPEDVWWFDRPATRQDASKRLDAHNTSDIILNSTVILPVILGFDKNIRKDWLDLLLLYGESHAITSNLYILNASLISRPRPFNYNPDVPVEDKMANESRNSWYSGHVTTTAAASFFAAKVYSDYHPELGNKKYWFFAAAAIPPSLVGFYRYKAMKHFPTDIIAGTLAGAATGILIPHLHKNRDKESAWNFIPFAGKINGFQLSYTFR